MIARCPRCGSIHTETLSADGSGYRMIPALNMAASSTLALGPVPGLRRLVAAGLVLHLLVSKALGLSRRSRDLYLVCPDCGHYARL